MAKTVENVIEEGFELVKKNYASFVELYVLFILIFFAIGFIGILAFLIVGGGALAAPAGTSNGDAIIFFICTIIVVALLIEPVWIGAYYAIALQYLRGGRISVMDAVGAASAKYLQLLWTMVLETFIFLVADIIILSPLIVPLTSVFNSYQATGSLTTALESSGPSLIGIGLVVAIMYLVVSIALAPLLYESVPLVMLEGVSGVKAIKESIEMGKQNFWKIIWLLVIMVIIYLLIEFAQGILVGLVNAINALAGSVVSLIVTILVGAFISAWLT